MHQKVDQNLQTEIGDLFEEVTGVEASSVTSSGDANENVLILSLIHISPCRVAPDRGRRLYRGHARFFLV